MASITWLDDEQVTEVRITEAPRHYSATGYGAKIPTQYMLQLQSGRRQRWHRVYMMCYSNSGTAYVLKGGQRLVLDTGTEHRIQLYRDAQHLGLGGLKFPARQVQPVQLGRLSPGDRFCFRFDGVVNTLVSFGAGPAPEGQVRSGRYTWTDYQGEHVLHSGTDALGKTAWPYVHLTDEPETVVKAA